MCISGVPRLGVQFLVSFKQLNAPPLLLPLDLLDINTYT